MNGKQAAAEYFAHSVTELGWNLKSPIAQQLFQNSELVMCAKDVERMHQALFWIAAAAATSGSKEYQEYQDYVLGKSLRPVVEAYNDQMQLKSKDVAGGTQVHASPLYGILR